jgi:hypothetical protein
MLVGLQQVELRGQSYLSGKGIEKEKVKVTIASMVHSTLLYFLGIQLSGLPFNLKSIGFYIYQQKLPEPAFHSQS